MAGIKGYVTHLDTCQDGSPVTAGFVFDAYHRLFQVEKSFACRSTTCKPGRSATTNASIDGHLSIVFAALAVSRWTEDRMGWSITKFVRTARRYRTIQIRIDDHILTTADPLPDVLRHAIKATHADPVRTNLIRVGS